MKRRHKAVYNRDTKVQMALVALLNNNTEKKAIVIDHLHNIGFIEDGSGGDMRLSVGVFNSTPTRYARIKRLIAGNFTASDSEIIDKAILGVSMEAPKTEKKVIEPLKPQSVELPTTTEDDLEREIACYNNAIERANQIVEKIDNLISTGVPRNYVEARYRYPDIKEKIQDFEYYVGKTKVELADAVGKKTAIKAKLYKLTTQLKKAEYDEYLKQEQLISMLKNFTDELADLDDGANSMLEEDLDELDRLKKIKELEEKLTALKSESKLFSVTASAPSTPTPVTVEPAEKPAKLEVELPTEQQDKEIRFLANHLYQVRRGNEEHNPAICRRIADLSAKLKLTKAEFCKKVLSISVQCWDDRHREYFTSLGLHLNGERHFTTGRKRDLKNEIKKWADSHIISADGNDVLNSDVYDKFVRDTGFSDIAKISFYNVLARSLGYTHKCKYRRDSHGKTICDTYYSGCRLI